GRQRLPQFPCLVREGARSGPRCVVSGDGHQHVVDESGGADMCGDRQDRLAFVVVGYVVEGGRVHQGQVVECDGGIGLGGRVHDGTGSHADGPGPVEGGVCAHAQGSGQAQGADALLGGQVDVAAGGSKAVVV